MSGSDRPHPDPATPLAGQTTGSTAEPVVARVVVTVGTDHHPFERLVRWIDTWASANPTVPVLVQHGTAGAPRHARGVAMLGYDEMVAAMGAADVVVAQGGPAAIMDARSVGRLPIVVPRRHALGEHVDDHQVTFTRWMSERGHATLASSEEELASLLDRAVREPGAWTIPPTDGDTAAAVEAFGSVVEPLLARRGGRGGSRRGRRIRR